MPRQPTITESQLENLTACLTPAVRILNELNEAFAPPFIQPISNTIFSLINLVQNIKRNKKECTLLVENVYQVLYTMISLHIKSETAGSLPPAMIVHVGKFRETLHKIYIYIEAQQERNKFKHLFRNNEMNNLLKDCHAGLDQALQTFELTSGGAMFNNIGEMKKVAENMHKQLLELVSTLSETTTTSDNSSVYLGANSSNNSSHSFSLLPSKPKIFHGRDTEVENIVKILGCQSPRIAILGGGGMGKTSLARTVLHHLETLAKFEQRFFVSAESATTTTELVALIGLHVGLNPGKDLTRAVVQYLSRLPFCLLILDNLETVWEPVQSRGEVEEFLGLLTDVKHLALIITMRGSERPNKVQWTRPFLLPLQSLSDAAAQQTFLDITDNFYTVEDLNPILRFTDNMPLAVDLIANLVDYEGIETVLARWKTEKTSILSMGSDRKSSLDASISLSLSSSRITSDSKTLLSLLSILPNGLSDAELVQSNLPIPNILSCKAILLATSLAYQNDNKRLLVLMPVREHIQQFLPPSVPLIHSLCVYFSTVLELYKQYKGKPVINQITANLGNLQEVLQRGLSVYNSNVVDTIYCVISLNSFYRVTGHYGTSLMYHIQDVLPRPTDYQLEIHFFTEALRSRLHHRIFQPEKFIIQGISHFQHFVDPLLESKFYQAAHALATYKFDFPRALQFNQKAQELAILCGDDNQQCRVLMDIAYLKIQSGDYSNSQVYAKKAQQLAESPLDLRSALFLHAQCDAHLGNYNKSMTQFQKAREISEVCGMSGDLLDQNIRFIEADIHTLKSEYAQARNILNDVIQTISVDYHPQVYAIVLCSTAHIDIQSGSVPQTIWKDLDRATELYDSLDSFVGIIKCKIIRAEMERRECKFDLAYLKFRECLHFTLGRHADIESSCLEQLANIKAWPTTTAPLTWPIIYLGFAYKAKEKLALHKALLFLGDVFKLESDEITAFNLYNVALAGFTQMDVHQSRAQCMMHLGDLAHKQGNTSEAIIHWNAAQPLFECSLQVMDVAQIDSRLAAVEEARKEALGKLAALQVPTQLVTEYQEKPVKTA
ncbi:hypothetical protein C8R45DRAFT_1068835 [Mycena sanguinolenta]|nr:hypothetical protein C8R45DRAFT_1068835 [Mycena sanguinolenta]